MKENFCCYQLFKELLKLDSVENMKSVVKYCLRTIVTLRYRKFYNQQEQIF